MLKFLISVLKKVSHCKSTKELLALAKQEGVELNDEQLAAVNGGLCEDEAPVFETCPDCGNKLKANISKQLLVMENIISVV